MNITVYSRITCPPCKTLKQILKNRNITFNVIDADANPEEFAAAEVRHGYTTVPRMELNNELFMVGLQPAKLSSLF